MPRVRFPQVRFTLYSTKDVLRKTYIYAYFHYKGKRLRYVTGERVCPDGWDFERQRAKVSRKYLDGPDINDRLNRLESLIIKIFRDSNFGDIEPAEFSKQLDILMGFSAPEKKKDKERRVPTLMEFIDEYLQDAKTNKPDGRNSWKIIPLLQNQLKAYSADKGRELDFKDMNPRFFDTFKAWLYAPPRNYRINYVTKLFRVLRTILGRAHDYGIMEPDNIGFKKISVSYVRTDEISLTAAEIRQMLEYDFSDKPALERTRDLFLIGYFAGGMRWSDYRDIRPEHIKEVDGMRVIQKVSKKVKSLLVIPIIPVLDKLLAKYQYNTTKIVSSDVVLNRNIKEVCRLLGMTELVIIRDNQGGVTIEKEVPRYEMIASHTARRSFATNLTKANVPTSLISFALDHKTEAQTKHYIRIDQTENAKLLSVALKGLQDDKENGFMFEP
jgi:integrase